MTSWSRQSVPRWTLSSCCRMSKTPSTSERPFGSGTRSTCAIEIASGAQPYYAVDYPRKVCLVVGNEYHGVTRRTLDACDAAIFLPMYGKIESLNVHVALGIASYHILHSRVTAEK